MDLFAEDAAAIHEVGHAFIARRLGIQFSEISIKYSDELKRWTGEFSIDAPQGLPHQIRYLQLVPVVSVAGAFAQSKYCIEKSRKLKFRFDLSYVQDSLVTFLTDTQRSEDAPGILPLAFIDLGKQVDSIEIEFDGRIFSSLDSRQVNNSIKLIPNMDLRECVVEAMRILDDDDNWSKIKLAAKELITQNPVPNNNGIRRLCSSEINRIFD